MKSRQLLFFLLLIPVLIFSACTQSEEQQQFEREALRAPSGITETDDQGRVNSTDEDDWRVSPLYQGLIDVRPPFPNPVVLGSPITFEISVTGVQSIDGVQVFELLDTGDLLELFSTVDISGMNTFIVFEINSQQFQNLGGGTAQRGLHRIIIYDFNNQMITYGDVQVD